MRDARDPLEQLASTHDSLRERMQDLRAAATDRGDPERRASAQAALEDVLHWTGRGLARHERDEEESLFPRLRDDPELSRICEALAVEHREHERAIVELRAAIAGEDQAALERAADRVAGALEAHVAREDAELLPRARAVLSADAIAAIGAEMEARRGGGRGGGRG